MALSPRTRNIVITGSILVAAVGIYAGQLVFGPKDAVVTQSISNPVPADFVIPQFNEVQTKGQVAFTKSCQACHGQFALGSDIGPSFIQEIYAPRVHADGAFIFAASQGSRQHHFGFGNMPEVDGTNNDEVETIIQYVRSLQAANGIE